MVVGLMDVLVGFSFFIGSNAEYPVVVRVEVDGGLGH